MEWRESGLHIFFFRNRGIVTIFSTIPTPLSHDIFFFFSFCMSPRLHDAGDERGKEWREERNYDEEEALASIQPEGDDETKEEERTYLSRPKLWGVSGT